MTLPSASSSRRAPSLPYHILQVPPLGYLPTDIARPELSLPLDALSFHYSMLLT